MAKGKPAAEKGLVPRLRFPEFKADKPWDRRSLGKVFGRITNGKANAQDHVEGGAYPLFDRSDDPKRSNNYMFDSEVIILPGEGAHFLPRHYVGKFNLHQRAYALMDCNGVSKFANYALTLFEPRLAKVAVSSTVRSLRLPIIQDFNIPLPDGREQQKVADCLSSLDERIAAETRQLDALKTHKQGLLQQLFPHENEAAPRLRFPEFTATGVWVSRTVGDLMPVGSSKRVHQSDWTNSGVPFYRAREIVALADGGSIAPLHISEQLYREFASLTGEVQAGHLLVTGVGSIGVPYLVSNDGGFYFKDGNIVWLKNDQKYVLGGFLHLAYTTKPVQAQIKHMAGIGTVGTYTIESAKRTEIVFPEDKTEQQKIADCLTSLDDLIVAQGRKVALLKQHKRGLMQQLFPVLDEVAA